MSLYKPEPIFNHCFHHGEGPFWDGVQQKMYWVDILKHNMLCGNIDTAEFNLFPMGQPIGVAAKSKSNGFVMALRDGFATTDQYLAAPKLIEPSPEQHNEDVRFNDGVVSPGGHFFAGTMEWDGIGGQGKLFKLNSDYTWEKVEESLFIPNGMGFSTDLSTFFMIDTGRHCMFAYDYDLPTGNISNRRVFVQFQSWEDPDGMTIDAEDNFWIAMWGGGKILRLNNKGKRTQEVSMPVPYPTSCCFIGDNLDKLFITSSRLVMGESEINEKPLSGSCFIMDTDTKGRPDFEFG